MVRRTSTHGTAYVGYAQAPGWGPQPISGVPTGAIVFAHDIGTRRSAETPSRHPLDRLDRGGHFAALGEPAALTDDVRACFRDLG